MIKLFEFLSDVVATLSLLCGSVAMLADEHDDATALFVLAICAILQRPIKRFVDITEKSQ